MNKIRAFIYISALAVIAILAGLFLNQLINSKLDQTAPAQTQANALQSNQPDQSNTASETALNAANAVPATPSTTPAQEVTTIKLSQPSAAFLNTIGTVKSQNSISLFPQTSATVQQVNFQEGDLVKAGDVIVELTGSNLTDHPSVKQLKIAQTTYDNAEAALDNLINTNNEALKTAQLQVQSALSQANAVPYDLQTIEQNQAGLQDSLNILEDSLQQTRDKNSRDLAKSRSDIDDLINNINNAQDSRAQTLNQISSLQNQLDYASADQAAGLQTQLSKLQEASNSQEKAINDLYTAIDKARYGYSTALNAVQLSENQIKAQIAQSQSQLKNLQNSLDGTKTKLGYTGESTDALKLAEQSFNATKAQLQSAINNAANQLKLAKLNLELAKDQTSSLSVKAPVDGLITGLNLSPGQSVNAQTVLAELINPKEFQLEVYVDAFSAEQIDASNPAQIQLGDKWLQVPIKSISPKVDEKTRLVKVTLKMPNIFFRANQSISAKLPLSANQGNQTGAVVLPLDAVTIATESQFVYVNNNGFAKRTEVKTGAINGDQIEILEGLGSNDEIILGGAKSLTDGQAIIIK